MKIKKTKCKLCEEETEFAFIYYEDFIPICLKCIRFIKSLKMRDLK